MEPSKMSNKTEIPRLEKCFPPSIKVFNAKDPDHGSNLLKRLHNMYKDQRYCDVTLNIGDERKLPAHRVVLASFSGYFEARLGSNWEEGRQDEVELLGFDESVVSSLIEFAYSGNIDISTENVQTLLEAANYLGVEFVHNSCAEFLKNAIDDKTCLAILQLADIFALEELKKVSKQYALRHFVGVCNEEGFLNLPYNLLVELLGDDDLCVVIEGSIPHVEKRENFVLQRVFQYVEHDLSNRREHLPELLSLVRLPTLSVTHLQDLSKHELIASQPSSKGPLSSSHGQKRKTRESLELRLITQRCAEVFDKAQKLKLNGSGSGPADSKWLTPRPCGKDVLFWGFPCGKRDPEKEVSCFPESDAVNKIQSLNEDIYVKGMKLWMRPSHHCCPELTGLRVFYSDNSEMMSGCDAAPEHHEFHLEEDERIVRAVVEFVDNVIYKLTFYTNKRDAHGEERKYGLYGGGTLIQAVHGEPHSGTFAYLVGVSGAVMRSQAGLSISQVQFAWNQFVFPGDVVPPKGRCRVAGDYSDEEDEDDWNEDDDDSWNDSDDSDDIDDDDDLYDLFHSGMPIQPYMFEPLA